MNTSPRAKIEERFFDCASRRFSQRQSAGRSAQNDDLGVRGPMVTGGTFSRSVRLDLQANEAHEFERIAFGYDPLAQLEIEAHFAVFDVILEVGVAYRAPD